jgi:hypothetical protein
MSNMPCHTSYGQPGSELAIAMELLFGKGLRPLGQMQFATPDMPPGATGIASEEASPVASPSWAGHRENR